MKHEAPNAPLKDMLRPIDAKDKARDASELKKDAPVVFIVYVVLLVLGVATGYVLAGNLKGASVSTSGSPGTKSKVVGVKDASTFKDCANGTLEQGGVDGEGTHKLIRDGGPSQTAYLVSSVVDLDQYVNLKVKVCGQTMAAKKVSWLMDVGRLEFE